jgi:N-acetylglutamate synthase-like GNAT family acetyltransferase
MRPCASVKRPRSAPRSVDGDASDHVPDSPADDRADEVVSGAYSTRRIRRDDDVVALLERNEPRATQALGEVLDRGLRSRTCRAWIVEDGARRPAAAVVVARPTFDRWYAMVLLLDERAAAEVASLVDRSPAWSVNGAAPDIAPLVPLLKRQRSVDVRPWVVTAYPVEVTQVPDDSTRLATKADLDALVELYSTFEFVGGLTAWQLRAMLRHVLDRHYIIVIGWPGDEARLAGALAITTRTRRYGVLDLLTVVPDHRGAGWSWALVAHAQSIGNELGLAGVAALAGSNPMDLKDHLRDDTYVAVELVPPRRFRGQGRLRKLYHHWQPLQPRATVWFHEPNGS